jgi:hypothetical protein
MAGWVDYYLGRQVRCAGAAAQRGGCGANAGPNAAGDPATRPGRHDYSPNRAFHHASLAMGIAELLRLVGAARRLAFDRNLPPDDALRRIRDAFADYDHA